MNEPAPLSSRDAVPLGAKVVVAGLAAFGAVTLVAWLIGAVMGILKTVIAVVVIIALLSWLAGSRVKR